MQIQPDDILEIVVNSINTDAAAPFNMGNSNPAPATSITNITRHANGNISPSNTGGKSP